VLLSFSTAPFGRRRVLLVSTASPVIAGSTTPETGLQKRQPLPSFREGRGVTRIPGVVSQMPGSSTIKPKVTSPKVRDVGASPNLFDRGRLSVSASIRFFLRVPVAVRAGRSIKHRVPARILGPGRQQFIPQLYQLPAAKFPPKRSGRRSGVIQMSEPRIRSINQE
jgi:hypothetical protein